MILRQFLHAEPTAASYLLGCVGNAAGVVVDPLFPIEPSLEAASSAGTPIRLKALPDPIENPALRIDDPDMFVAFILENIPPAPEGAVEPRAWNANLTA